MRRPLSVHLPHAPSEALSLHRSQFREIALRHRVSSVRVFGSALNGDDTADSHLDLLVELTAQTTLMGIGAIRYELKQLLSTEVDVLHPQQPTRQLLRAGTPRGDGSMSRAQPQAICK